ncbi:MAG TPA: class D sortase [Bryobacteraceae bacterium]|nr:class D sortase [Bryobacteraceae bacterium]
MRARNRRKWRRFLSSALIIGGCFLLGRGAREIFDAYWGQRQANKEFANRLGKPAPESKTPGSKTVPNVPAPPARPHLEPGETVARLSIPRLGAELYVVEGTDNRDLRLGPGHMPGTALPGENGNCVIAGHRDTHFRILRKIRPGDEIALETLEGRFVYTVDGTAIVKPTNVSSLAPSKSGVLHLITCYPFYFFGHAPKRFVVEAKLDPQLSASARAKAPAGPN